MKALIFDLDDTLVVEQAAAEAAFLQTCQLARLRHGIDPAGLHATLRQTARRLWHRSPARAYAVAIGISSWEALWARFEGPDEPLRTLRAWAPVYRRDSWHQALRKHGIDDLDFASELADVFGVERRKRHVVYDDVLPALKHVETSYRLGLLTNGASDLQREKIAGAGIGHYFDEIVISGDIGVGKPNPRIFQTMLSRLAVTAGEAMMIGNSLTSDIEGAHGVGMKTVWINREGNRQDGAVMPDHELAGLGALRHVLDTGTSHCGR